MDAQPPNSPPATKPPLGAQVRARIEGDILAGHLKPGERLIEEDLARRYGVSRSPIREAVRGLASEGLIELSARRGAVVAALTPQEAREFVEVRALLEGYTARLAARYRRPAVLDRAEAILREGASGQGDLAALNAAFHDTLAEAGGNATVRALTEGLRKRSARVFQAHGEEAQRRTWAEHQGILEAILAGDEELAATRAEAHVRSAGAPLLAGD